MRFLLTGFTFVDVDERFQAVLKVLDPLLENFFVNKSYGAEVQSFVASIRIVPDQFNRFMNVKKNYAYMFSKERSEMFIESSIDYQDFIHSDFEQCVRLVIDCLFRIVESILIHKGALCFDAQCMLVELKDLFGGYIAS